MAIVDPTARGNPIPLTQASARALFDAAWTGKLWGEGQGASAACVAFSDSPPIPWTPLGPRAPDPLAGFGQRGACQAVATAWQAPSLSQTQ
jgi:hypothetical protein